MARRPPRWLRRRFSPFHAIAAGTMLMLSVFVLAVLLPEERIVSDAEGAYRASCGLEYFLFGTEVQAVEEACRAAYRDNAVTGGLAVLAFLVLLVLFLVRRGPVPDGGEAGWMEGWRQALPPSRASTRWLVVTVLLVVATYLQVVAGVVR